MTLTADHIESGSDRRAEQPVRPASVEQWLVMYGIRPNATARRTFVPITYRHPAATADWLRTMWGLTVDEEQGVDTIPSHGGPTTVSSDTGAL